MSDKTPAYYANYTLSSLQQVATYTSGLDQESFTKNTVLVHAVCHWFIVSGEACNRVGKSCHRRGVQLDPCLKD